MQKPWNPPVGTLPGGLIVLGVGLVVGGCQSAHERHTFSPPPADLFPPGEHRLLSGDDVVFRFPEETNYTARVIEDGTVSLPLIGSVNATGKTSYELQVEVSKLYVPRFYKRWFIPGDQRVYVVGGQVRSPGRQVYLSATTVTKAIQSAGDFTDFASKRRVELVRANGQKIEVNCIRAARDPSLDLPVYPGDKIDVPQRTFWEWFR